MTEKEEEYSNQYAKYVFELRQKYKEYLSFENMKNAEIDLFSKLFIQWKYSIPVEVIENYNKVKEEENDLFFIKEEINNDFDEIQKIINRRKKND